MRQFILSDLIFILGRRRRRRRRRRKRRRGRLRTD
ncbi:hypothetical protein ACFW04_002151 [Cataglyphis niger]